MKTWILIPILTFLAGCAGSARPIPANVPHASLKFGPTQGTEAIGAYWYENDQCKAGAYSGKVGTLSWMSGREVETTIPAGKAVYVAQLWIANGGMATPHSCGAPICMKMVECRSMVEFVPEQGRTYAAQLDFGPNSCITKIVDTSHGASEMVQGQRPLESCLGK